MRAACGLVLILAAGALSADDKPARLENPYRDAKVGDWVEWKSNDVVVRHTVTARAEARLTLKIDQTIGGTKGPPIEQAIDLKGPYPPVAKKDPDDETKTVTEKLGSGKETLTIVGSAEAAPREGRISNESPIGQALMGHKKGETVTVDAPAGAVTYTLVSIR